jgi:hypothetical protein
MLGDLMNFLKTSSICLPVDSNTHYRKLSLLASTVKKLVSPFMLLSPIPVNKNPVTVSSSPMTAMTLEASPFFKTFLDILFNVDLIILRYL